jgi:anti-sigma B factor antagonist
MSFKMNQRKTGDVTVLDVNGRIVLGEETNRLQGTLKELAAGGEKKLLLNLADVTYVDSAGLGALVRCHTAVMEQDGQIKLLNVPPKVQTLLKITKLHHLFESFDDEAAAVNSFT